MIEVNTLTLSDSSQRLAALAQIPVNNDDPNWSHWELKHALAQGHIVLYASISDQVLGYIVSSQVLDEAEILVLIIDAKKRRTGIGSALLSALHQALIGKAKKCFLEVRQSNRAARTLYEQSGYIHTGRRRRYYLAVDGRREDALLMSYTLPEIC